ncbi:MAG: ArsA family ATPase [Actinobacteria bacterium]|nr:MAG: ArsA family ATPase [Actinomycetota bacterium]
MTPSAADRAPGVLAKRLLFVTGKGGVGKTTVAAALGVLAARAGRRTLVAEVARRQDVSRTLAGEHAPEMGAEIELAPGLFWTTIEPQGAMEEYLTDQLPVRALADLLIHSRAFTYFAAATPGLRELLTVGKVWELSQPQRRTPGGQPYDLVVVDAPATGHGMAYLAAPRTFADAARVGPIARQGRIIHQMLTDPRRTGVIAVSTPDDMPVSEALILHRELPRQMGIELERVVVNAVQPRRFSPKEARAIRAARDEVSERGARAALNAALSQHLRSTANRRGLERVRRATGRPAATLPVLFEPTLGKAEIELLADRLERTL